MIPDPVQSAAESWVRDFVGILWSSESFKVYWANSRVLRTDNQNALGPSPTSKLIPMSNARGWLSFILRWLQNSFWCKDLAWSWVVLSWFRKFNCRKIFYGNTVTQNIELLGPLLPQLYCLRPQSWLSGFGKVTCIKFRVYVTCVGKYLYGTQYFFEIGLFVAQTYVADFLSDHQPVPQSWDRDLLLVANAQT